MEEISVAQLRENTSAILTQVMRTGEPQYVRFNGVQFQITPSGMGEVEEYEEGEDKLSRLVPHPDAVVGDPDELITINTCEWYMKRNS